MRLRHTSGAIALIGCALSVAGCGSSSPEEREEPAPPSVVATGSHTATCEKAAIGNLDAPQWRTDVTAAGPFVLLGPGRDFRSLPVRIGSMMGGRFADLFVSKIPAGLNGRTRVTVTVPASSRRSAGLQYGKLGPYEQAYAEITSVLCPRDKGTGWPGGIVHRGTQPVTLLVQAERWAHPKRIEIGRI